MIKRTIEKKVATQAHGRYAWLVMDKKTQTPVQYSDRFNNHIFSGGLNQIDQYTWSEAFQFCVVGTQPNPQKSTGNYEGEFGAALQNQIGSANNSYFTGFVAAPFFVTGCATIPLGEAGSVSGIKMRRTFDFDENQVGEFAESPDIIYTEIGWKPTSNGDLFSRIVTNTGNPDEHVPITVKEGQFLRIIYELDVSFPAANQTYTGEVITGYTLNSEGQANIQNLGLSQVNFDGSNGWYDNTSGANEPSVVAWGFLSEAGEPLALIGNTVNRATGKYHENRCHHFTYIPDSFEKVKRFFVSGDFAVGSGWRTMGIGPKQDGSIQQSGITAERNSFAYVFDDAFAKEKDYLLNVLFKYSWSSLT